MKILNTATPPEPLHLLLIAFLGLGVFVAPGLTPPSLWAQEAGGVETSIEHESLETTIDVRPGDQPTPPSPRDRILWQFEEPPIAFFIPQAVLARTPLESLPLDRALLSSLRRKLADQQLFRRWNQTGSLEIACLEVDPENQCGRRQSTAELSRQTGVPEWYLQRRRDRQLRSLERERDRRTVDGCLPVTIPTAATELPTIEDFLAYGEEILVGEVIETVPGWNVRWRQPVTEIYVEVLEVIRRDSADIWPGDVVSFPEGYGTILVEDTKICAEITGDHDRPTPLKVGDRVLIQGEASGEENRLVRTIVSPVVGDVVHSRSGTLSYLPLPVSEVIARLWETAE